MKKQITEFIILLLWFAALVIALACVPSGFSACTVEFYNIEDHPLLIQANVYGHDAVNLYVPGSSVQTFTLDSATYEIHMSDVTNGYNVINTALYIDGKNLASVLCGYTRGFDQSSTTLEPVVAGGGGSTGEDVSPEAAARGWAGFTVGMLVSCIPGSIWLVMMAVRRGIKLTNE